MTEEKLTVPCIYKLQKAKLIGKLMMIHNEIILQERVDNYQVQILTKIFVLVKCLISYIRGYNTTDHLETALLCTSSSISLVRDC